MNDINHQEARILLQKNADQMLNQEEKEALVMHLKDCKTCLKYANHLSTLEINLRNTFHTKWDFQQPEYLTPQKVISSSPSVPFWNIFTYQSGLMSKATMIAVFLLVYLVVANTLGLRKQTSGIETATILPTPINPTTSYTTSPTPSAQRTSVDTTTQACDTFIYIVKENDTLARIALQHGKTKEHILEYNELKSNTVFLGQEIIIPACNGTPSFTATAP